LEFAKTKLANH